jgi:hypothetical protein
MAIALPGNLVGNYFVRAIRPAFHDAHKWLPKASDRAELRRHALKLRFWPERHPVTESGELLDLNWSWINSLKGKRVGELRISDTIGNCNNLRIIFFDPQIREPLPMLWVLAVLQKKRDDFTKAQIDNFDLRRTLVLERFYHDH